MTEENVIQQKIKDGKWQTFKFMFDAQFEGFAIHDGIVIIAAPDFKDAISQFEKIIDTDKKQLVRLKSPGSEDTSIGFVNLKKSDAIFLKEHTKEKCPDCTEEECTCQKKED